MKTVVALIAVLVGCISVSGQSRSRKVVVWSGDVNCGYVRLPAETPRPSCHTSSTPRGPVSTISLDLTRISIAFLEDDGLILLAAQIENGASEPLDIDTDLWGAAHFAKMSDFESGRKPILAETAVPSREIARSIKSGIGIENSSDTFLASISKTTEVKEVRRNDGTRVRQAVVVDDKDAVRDADARNTSRRKYRDAEQTRIRKDAITQKWVAANDKVKGLVYFRRVKKAGFVVFSLRIEDTNYVFRFSRKT